jgi:hypothetical protein
LRQLLIEAGIVDHGNGRIFDERKLGLHRWRSGGLIL